MKNQKELDATERLIFMTLVLCLEQAALEQGSEFSEAVEPGVANKANLRALKLVNEAMDELGLPLQLQSSFKDVVDDAWERVRDTVKAIRARKGVPFFPSTADDGIPIRSFNGQQ